MSKEADADEARVAKLRENFEMNKKDEEMEQRLIAFSKGLDIWHGTNRQVIIVCSANLGLLVYYLGDKVNDILSGLFWFVAVISSVLTISVTILLVEVISHFLIDFALEKKIRKIVEKRGKIYGMVRASSFILSIVMTVLCFFSV